MTPTLPGSLPGLLRIGSPVILSAPYATKGMFIGALIDFDGYLCLDQQKDKVNVYTSDQICLDLSDPTGRIHALWWVEAQKPIDGRHAIDMVGVSPILMRIVLRAVTKGKELTESEVDRFRRFCLSYAGVASV